MPRPIQDAYPDDAAHCYGCGRHNPDGLMLKSAWEGEEVVARFTPRPYHTAMPGFVYGGLTASLIDCHAMATAAAAAHRQAGGAEDAPVPRYVTAALKVDYLRPTPLGPLELRAVPREIKGRKVIVSVRLLAGGAECARGEVVAVQVPEGMLGKGTVGAPG
jgi:acyl-coenzyme A thioesterase PaaI-like protein